MLDLVIKGGTVVTAGSSFSADIGIQDGKVAQIGGEMSASMEIDASGKLVIPGGLDMHVHLTWHNTELRWVDDFYSGTAAAVAGGVTTIGNVTFPNPEEGLLQALDRVEAEARANAIIDFTLHPVVIDPSPEEIAEIPKLVEAGYSSIKTFTQIGRILEQDHIKAFEVAGQSGILTMIHCEDADIIHFCEQRLLAEGKSDIRYYADSRPTYSEASAVARAVAAARATDAPIYIVHLSSEAALGEARRARAMGQGVYVETRPIYLYLTRERFEEPEGAKYVGYPCLREQADVDALWNGLRAGDIDTYCSDHAPLDKAQSLDSTLKVGNFRGAMPGLETLMPLLYSEGVRKGRISLSRWVELTSTNAAKLFGMFPQKGTICVGSDADIVVWDPNRRRNIVVDEMRSASDFEVYEGWEIQGWPSHTISRGQVVFENDRVTGVRGWGRRVIRGPHTSL